ncbi:hypothetical protein SLEP1_g30623 [Rubroshorea leprosula]|uniref:Uncharacterized protein n=1 Tax=Rubroshorea leprosula TaxID=152421 RepID=A0AAV5K872_9ROSI|nr:hypothetical protein SLEP1_g30623 [Rubroshorea leprosula]
MKVRFIYAVVNKGNGVGVDGNNNERPLEVDRGNVTIERQGLHKDNFNNSHKEFNSKYESLSDEDLGSPTGTNDEEYLTHLHTTRALRKKRRARSGVEEGLTFNTQAGTTPASKQPSIDEATTATKQLNVDVAIEPVSKKKGRPRNIPLEQLSTKGRAKYKKTLAVIRRYKTLNIKPRIGGPFVFQGMYVCLKVLTDGWKNGSKPLIGVDGCFLKGVCKGILLATIGRDENEQMYPMAWAVVDFIKNLALGITGKWSMELEKAEFSLGNVINVVVSQVMLLLRERNLQLIWDIPEEIKTLAVYGWVAIHVHPSMKQISDGLTIVHTEFKMVCPGEGLPPELVGDMCHSSRWITQEGLRLSMCRKILKLMNGEVQYIRESERCYFLIILELPIPPRQSESVD